MIECIDSHYRAVKARIIAQNPQRIVVDVGDAGDWPPKTLQMEAFYLNCLGSVPMGRAGFSAYAMGMVHLVQWVWVIQGQDLPPASQGVQVRGRNRGSRYRTDWQMKTELMNGLYPYFTEKLSWSAQQAGAAIQLSGVPMTDPGTNQERKEFITWTPPTFSPKKNEAVGLIYGAAQVHISDFSDAIVS